MSAIVDYGYYATVYMGSEADEASFPALCARAMDIVGAMTRWIDPETLTGLRLTLYKEAVCAQVDYFAVNGADILSEDDGRGWTVGKVSISGKAGGTERRGALAENVAPMVIAYLEQTGLMGPQVETAVDMPFVGWL